jgi:molybdate transport system substrate-binding protein
MQVNILSGGAAQGLVGALAPQFKAETGCDIAGTFGAVGAMRDKLLSGTPADLLILTRALIEELTAAGHAVSGSAVDVGTVQTAVAVRDGDPSSAVGDAAALRAVLLAADAIYFPDPKLATAGIHFASILNRLGIATEVAGRLKTFPNGATAMAALAAAATSKPIGCTQVTEILSTPGVRLVAPLPNGYELATVYTAAVTSSARAPDMARHLARLLSADVTRLARTQAGFV